MFNLERAIADWRSRLVAEGVEAGEVLEELESHLRDDLAIQAQDSATNQAQAFEAAVRRIGEAAEIRQEFAKAGRLQGLVRVRRLFFRLAGVPNRFNHMNTTPLMPATEPGWTTYLKAAAFLTPALGLWAFSWAMFLPKLNQICRDAGQVLPWAFQLGIFVTHNAVVFFALAALVLGILEWRASLWPRYRRRSIGVGVFLLNALVLLQITTMVFLALIAAPRLFQPGH